LRLWDYAVAAWGRPSVEGACLTLQDEHGQCVPLLLWRAWAAAEGRPVVDPAAAIAQARAWEDEVIAPLRGVRRRLTAETAVGDKVRVAELAAERALLEGLEAGTPAPGGARENPSQALARLAQAWNGAAPAAAIAALAGLLG
jgi:uncharacterized protein (TIGR02444 family)